MTARATHRRVESRRFDGWSCQLVRLMSGIGIGLSTAFTAFTGFARPVAPPPAPIELYTIEWHAPVGCPLERQVKREIDRLLGSDAEAIEAVHAQVNVTKEAPGWAASIATVSSQRRLTAADCHDLADAAALVIAMMVDPMAVDPNRPDPYGEEKAPSPYDPKPPSKPKPPVPLPARPLGPAQPRMVSEVPVWERPEELPPMVFGLGAEALVGAGDLPGVGLGVRPRFDIGLTDWRLSFAAEIWPSRATQLDGIDVEVGLVTGRITLGYAIPIGPIQLRPWAGFELGGISASTSGLAVSEASPSATWIAPIAGIEAGLRVHQNVELLAGIGGGWAAIRPRFVIDDVGLAHEVAGPIMRMSLGTLIIFDTSKK